MLFDLFVLMVAGEQLPQEANCKIYKLLWKTFHKNQLSLSQVVSEIQLFASGCWGGLLWK